jgi:ABC-type uncharacterized transport system ATPase subunit
VIEHDMGFVGDIAHQGDRFAPGRRDLEGSIEQSSRPIRRWWRFILATDPVLKVTTCTRVMARARCCTELNFSVAQGEIAVVVGRNGMGKSTLMKSLIGMLPVKSGRDRARRRRRGALQKLSARGEGDRFRAAGPHDLRQHDGSGEHRDRAVRVTTHRNPFRTTSTHCSRCCGK